MSAKKSFNDNMNKKLKLVPKFIIGTTGRKIKREKVFKKNGELRKRYQGLEFKKNKLLPKLEIIKKITVKNVKVNKINVNNAYSYITKWFKANNKPYSKGAGAYGLWMNRVNMSTSKKSTYKISGNVNILYVGQVEAVENVNNFKLPNITIPRDFNQIDRDNYLREFIQVNSNVQSGYITGLDIKLIKNKKQNLKNIKMKGLRKFYQNLKNINTNIKYEDKNDGYCVINYIWHEMKGRKGFNHMTKDKLIKEFENICEDIEQGITTEQIIKVIENYHPNISLYALDPMFNVFTSYISKNNNSKLILAFLVNNNHCYPILKEETKKSIALKKRLVLEETPEMEFKIKINDSNLKTINEDNVDAFINGELKGDVFILVDDKLELFDIVEEIIRKTQSLPVGFRFSNNHKLSSFVHPITNQAIVQGKDFYERKLICETLKNKYEVEQFEFKNQSHTNISTCLMERMIGKIKKSDYNKQTFEVLQDFYSKPMIQTIDNQIIRYKKKKGDIYKPQNIKGIDITKSYSSVLLNNKYDYPIYSIHDKIEKYNGEDIVCGEYYIESVNLPYEKTTHLKIKSGFYNANLIDDLLERKYINKKDIKYKFIPSFKIKYNTFKAFVEYVYNTFGDKIGKKLCNLLVGYFNTKSTKNTNGCLTDDIEVLYALITRANENNKNFSVDQLKDIFLFRESSKKPLYSNHSSLWRHVICGGISNLLRCLDLITDKQEVVGVNTDCVFYRGKTIILDDNDDDDDILKKLGTIHHIPSDECFPKVFVETEDIKLNLDNYKTEEGEGVIYTGCGGCGKSYKCCSMMKEKIDNNEDVVFLAKSNKAVINMKHLFNTLYKINDPPCYTFDSYLMDIENKENKLNKLNKTIFIDEFSMVDNYFMTLVYNAFTNFRNKIYMFGDMNQLPSVDSHTPFFYPFSIAVREMCPKIITLKFREQSGRYTEKLYNILSEFLDTGKINYQFKSINENLKRNIVYTNQKRKDILERLCTSGRRMIFNYQGKTEIYKICQGLLVQCIKNIKKRNMYNNEEYTIQKIEGENITLDNGQVFHSKEFSFSFLPLLACTTHKYQGGSINQNYNIYEADKMNRNMLYTALSRATHEDYIHIDNIKAFYEKAEYLKETFLIEPCQDKKYNKGKIYLITTGDNYYIGETTLDLGTRLEQHLKDINSPIYNLKHLKPKIKLIVKFPCFSHKELMKCEEKYIKIYKQMYGDKCLNKKQLETKTIKNEIKVNIKKYLRTDKFKIVDDEKRNCYVLEYQIDGVRKLHKSRYGKRTDKETALNKMEEKKKEICEFFDW